MVLARETSFKRLPHVFLWLWLFVLQFGLSNQATEESLAEDRVNKPWRPIPASRVTLKQARIFRWCSIIPCLVISIYYHNLQAAVAETLAFLAYNELGLANHWLSKNLLNAIGYAAFEAGAVIAALSGPVAPYHDCDG